MMLAMQTEHYFLSKIRKTIMPVGVRVIYNKQTALWITSLSCRLCSGTKFFLSLAIWAQSRKQTDRTKLPFSPDEQPQRVLFLFPINICVGLVCRSPLVGALF